MYNKEDFVIEDGQLIEYKGSGGDIVIPCEVTIIGYNAFWKCRNILSVEIPISVTEIGPNAFYECTGLKNIEIPESIAKIETRAFYGCTGLKSIRIPKGVTEIKFATFEGCVALTSVEIPDGVTKIGGSAFEGCCALNAITIPGSIVEIGERVFYGCSSLRELHIETAFKNLQKNLGYLNEYCKIYLDDLMILPPVLRRYAVAGFAENVQQISQAGKINYMKYIKSNVSKLVDIAIKNPKLLYLMCEEKLIKAKDSIMYLEEAQKSGDSEVIAIMLDYVATKISIKEKNKAEAKKDKEDETVLDKKIARVNKVGISGLVFAISGKLDVFKNREEMKRFIEEDGGIFASSISAKVDFLIMNPTETDSEKRLKAEKLGIEILTEDELVKKADRALVIPDGVTYLDNEYAYSNKYARIVLPQSLVSIGDFAFGCCRNIVSIEIPEGVKEIGEYAFSECSSLANVVIPESVVKIGRSAFSKCSSLTRIEIPKNVEIVSEFAFYECGDLTSVVVSDGVKEIGSHAFYMCEKLTHLVISDSVADIGTCAFSNCNGLANKDGFVIVRDCLYNYYGNEKMVVIPEGVTKIEQHAFYVYNDLISLEIPNGVMKIGSSYEFEGCRALTIQVSDGSYAEKYCIENNIPYLIKKG